MFSQIFGMFLQEILPRMQKMLKMPRIPTIFDVRTVPISSIPKVYHKSRDAKWWWAAVLPPGGLESAAHLWCACVLDIEPVPGPNPKNSIPKLKQLNSICKIRLTPFSFQHLNKGDGGTLRNTKLRHAKITTGPAA